MKQESNQDKPQSMVLELSSTRPVGSEKTKLCIKLELDCDMGFMTNTFIQLFKQDESLAMAAQVALMSDKGMLTEDTSDEEITEQSK